MSSISYIKVTLRVNGDVSRADISSKGGTTITSENVAGRICPCSGNRRNDPGDIHFTNSKILIIRDINIPVVVDNCTAWSI